MNTAKVALYLIMTLLAVVIFFALTGMDVRDPMPAVARIIDWSIQLNQRVNARVQGFFSRIRIKIFGGGDSTFTPNQPAEPGNRPLARLGRAINNLFGNLFGGLRDNSQEEFVEPINP